MSRIAHFSPTDAHATVDRIAATRAAFRDAAVELEVAAEEFMAFVEACCPLALEPGDAADRAYALGLEVAGVLDDLTRLARRISQRPLR